MPLASSYGLVNSSVGDAYLGVTAAGLVKRFPASMLGMLTSRFGYLIPTGDNVATWSTMGCSAPGAFDSSVATAPGVTNDALGNMKAIEYVQAANAVNRGAGWFVNTTFNLAVATTTREQFPIAFAVGLSDASFAIGAAFVGFATNPPLTTDPSAFINTLGFGFDVADANWQVMNNNAAGTAVKVDLGASFVRASRTPYLFIIDRVANGLGYDLYAVNLATAVTTAVTNTGTTEIPASDRTNAGVFRWSMASAFAPRITTCGMTRGRHHLLV